MPALFVTRDRRGVGKGRVVNVPNTVRSYEDVFKVIIQIRPLRLCAHEARRLGFAKKICVRTRMLAFAYLLGVMVGDMSKATYQGLERNTMQVFLKLSRRHHSNLGFGYFVVLCAGLLGIRMRRIKDCESSPTDKSSAGAYRWSSQSSELLFWIFEKCLGLGVRQTTTIDSIRAEWIVEAPRFFTICFLQGLADSDGYVDINKHEIGIIVEPNQILVRAILNRLHIRFRLVRIRNQATVVLSAKEGWSLPIFSPYAATHKFRLAKKLMEARRFRGRWPRWLRIEVDALVNLGLPSGEIVLAILERHGIAIRSQHLRRPSGGIAMQERNGAEGVSFPVG